MTLREELLALADPRYREFTASLIPGVGELLGIRIPLLRKIARTVRDTTDAIDVKRFIKIRFNNQKQCQELILINCWRPELTSVT